MDTWSTYTKDFRFWIKRVGEPEVELVFTPLTSMKKNVETKGIYPNPFSNRIHLPETTIGGRYQIFSLDGRILEVGTVNHPWLSPTVFSGIYMLQIQTQQGHSIITRIQKE